MESRGEKPGRHAGLFFCALVSGMLLLAMNERALAASTPSGTSIPEEMNASEKKSMVSQLLEEGDQYFKSQNYNLANATYESVFLLDPNNAEASRRIDRLKKYMQKEGKSETELVTRVYDEEIDARVRVYLDQAKKWIAEEKWGQARFALQKLLLINPLHQEARKLYDRVKTKEADATL